MHTYDATYQQYRRSQITGNSDVFSFFFNFRVKIIKAIQYWPIVESPNKRPVIGQAFPYYDVYISSA